MKKNKKNQEDFSKLIILSIVAIVGIFSIVFMVNNSVGNNSVDERANLAGQGFLDYWWSGGLNTDMGISNDAIGGTMAEVPNVVNDYVETGADYANEAKDYVCFQTQCVIDYASKKYPEVKESCRQCYKDVCVWGECGVDLTIELADKVADLVARNIPTTIPSGSNFLNWYDYNVGKEPEQYRDSDGLPKTCFSNEECPEGTLCLIIEESDAGLVRIGEYGQLYVNTCVYI